MILKIYFNLSVLSFYAESLNVMNTVFQMQRWDLQIHISTFFWLRKSMCPLMIEFFCFLKIVPSIAFTSVHSDHLFLVIFFIQNQRSQEG